MRTLLFVDDHPLFREGMQRALTQANPLLRVLVAEGVHTAMLALAADDDVDLCLADYRLGDGDGIALVQRIRHRYPFIALGLLCAEVTPQLVALARANHCVAMLCKSRATDSLTAAIDILFDGGEVFDEMPGSGAHAELLSARQREILGLAADGMLNRRIGVQLGITENTVKSHWKQIFDRLEVQNRAEAVSKALRYRLI
jgi:DNA-binding NarL/FixJ family response regulator